MESVPACTSTPVPLWLLKPKFTEVRPAALLRKMPLLLMMPAGLAELVIEEPACRSMVPLLLMVLPPLLVRTAATMKAPALLRMWLPLSVSGPLTVVMPELKKVMPAPLMVAFPDRVFGPVVTVRLLMPVSVPPLIEKLATVTFVSRVTVIPEPIVAESVLPGTEVLAHVAGLLQLPLTAAV